MPQRIVIVDDTAINRRVLESILSDLEDVAGRMMGGRADTGELVDEGKAARWQLAPRAVIESRNRPR